MARIRTIKPEFWTNPQVVHCVYPARLLFIGTWTFADDHGNLPRDPEKLKLQVFPGDEIDVEPLIDSLITHGLLTEYSNAETGEKYLHILTFRKHQIINRPSRPLYPLPGPPDKAGAPTLTEPSSLEGKRKGKGKGSKGVIDNLSLDSKVVGRAEKSARATRLAPDWRLPQTWGEWTVNALGWSREQVIDQAERFADYWHAIPGLKGCKLDWLATWRNWCKRARDFGEMRTNGAARRDEQDRQKARALTGYDSTKPREVLDLPPEDCHVIPTKH